MLVDRLIRAAVASATVAVLTAAMPIAAHAQAVLPADASGAEVLTALSAQSGDERATETAEAEEPAEEDDNSSLLVGLLVGLGIVAVVGASAAVRFRGSKAE
ncbi:MAG: hypothetical protein ABW156_09855 [Jiangellaceae bacterium]